MKHLIGALCLLPSLLFAEGLPGHLTTDDINNVVRIMGTGSAMRILRSAEPSPIFIGFRIGLELTLFGKGDLNDLGDKAGTLPNFQPTPRLYLAKGLPLNLEFLFTYFPGSVINTVNTVGGMMKWTFYDEKTEMLSGCAYFGMTGVKAFSSQYSGTDYELGALVSKDYTRLRPYLGGGFLLSQGTILKGLTIAPENTGSHIAIHLFGGFEYDLPITLSAQLDFMNFSPSISVMVAQKF